MTSGDLAARAAGTPLRRIDDLVQVVNSKIDDAKDPTKPYVGLEHMQSLGSALIGWSAAEESVSTNSVFAAGDILFGKLRPNLRKSVLAPFDGYCSTDVLVLRAREGVDPRFAARLFQSEFVHAVAEATAIGTKMPRTSWKDLRSIRVFCPFKAEQEKVADIVDTLDTAIYRTEAIVEKIEQAKRGLMHDLVTRGIGENGELRPPHSEAPQLYKRSPQGWTPIAWSLTRLSNLSAPTGNSFVNGPFGSDLLSGELTSTGVPVIYVQDVKPDSYRKISSAHVTETKANELAFCNVRRGDVLVAKVGSPPGAAAVYPYDTRAIVTQDVIRIRPNQGVLGEFLAAAINSSIGVAAIRRILIEGTRGRVSLTEFKRLLVPNVPAPEQKLIVARLQHCAQALHLAKHENDVRRKLRIGLMDDLLSGRVRVTSLFRPRLDEPLTR